MRKPLPLKKKILATLIRSAVVATVALPAMSWAQSSDAGLRGKAPPTMQITAKNIDTGLRRTTTSAADGSYALVGLPPGRYQVDAGPGTEKTVTLAVATTGTLDFVAPAGATAGAATLEGITVTGTALTEVKTSEIGTNVSLEQIRRIPQITRNFLEFADTVPGMKFQVGSDGHTQLRGGAQTTSAINVYIDGVGQKGYVLTGGVSGQDQSQGNPFPQLAIGEYKVITSNYKAEFDQIGSAAVVAQTKSGTNEFHGEVFGTHSDQDWRARTPAEANAGGKIPTYTDEFGLAIGGPIIQDTMHFFFSYEGKNFSTPQTVKPGDLVGLDQYLPPSARAQLGPTSKPFFEDLYFGKIDWEITDRDRVEVSGKYRNEAGRDDVGNTTAASASKKIANNDKRYDLRWEHTADSWYNDLKLTYESAFYNPTAYTFGNQNNYTNGTDQNKLVLRTDATSGLSIQDKGQKGPAIQDDLTFNNFNWMGDHTVKMGFKIKHVELTQSENAAINPQFFYAIGPGFPADLPPYLVKFSTPFPGTSPTITSKNKQYGVYIQDDWDVNDKLQLNLGVRWDYEKIPSYENFVTFPEAIAAFNAQDPNAPTGQTYAQTLAKGGININDYISNGHNRKTPKDSWAPRLGFSYDLNGDQEHVIYGGAGRSYDRNLFDYMGLESVKGALTETDVFFNPTAGCNPSNTCVNWDPKYLGGMGALASLVTAKGRNSEIDLLNNNLKVPYTDQFSIGMRNKVGDWNTSATVAYLHSKDGFVFTLGNRFPDGAFFKDGGQPWGNSPPGLGALILGDNGIETKTAQLLLSAEKPYTKDTGWGATFAYTYSHARGNRGGDEHYAFDGATIHDYPFIPLAAVPKHRFVATGTYDGWWDMTFTGKLTLETTSPFNDVKSQGDIGGPPDGSPARFYAAVNPPGKSFLFGGPIFGVRQIDLSVNKNFDLTRGMTFYVRLDAINIFNFINYKDYLINWGSNGVYHPVTVFNTSGDTWAPVRTVKLTAGFRF